MSEVIEHSSVSFKKLGWFYIASSALLASGCLLSRDCNPWIISLLMWCNFIGVFLIYRLNDSIDQHHELKFYLKKFLSHRLNILILIQLFILVIPIAIYTLEPFVFIVLSISAIIGIAYSIKFKIGNLEIRLKNVFLLKNLLIGFIWGALVFIGAGVANQYTIEFYIFVSLQVFIGGMIRDIPDLEKDRDSGVRSFPVVFGIKPTITFLHLINMSSLLLLFILGWNLIPILFFSLIVIWRMINLIGMSENPNHTFYSQWFNLFTCVLIFCTLFILYLYEPH